MNNGNHKDTSGFPGGGGVMQPDRRPAAGDSSQSPTEGDVNKGAIYLNSAAGRSPRSTLIAMNPGPDDEDKRILDQALARMINIRSTVTAIVYAGRTIDRLSQEMGTGPATFSAPVTVEPTLVTDIADRFERGDINAFCQGVRLAPVNGSFPDAIRRPMALIGRGNHQALNSVSRLCADLFRPLYWGYSFGGDQEASTAEFFLLVGLTSDEFLAAMRVDKQNPAWARYQKALVRWAHRAG